MNEKSPIAFDRRYRRDGCLVALFAAMLVSAGAAQGAPASAKQVRGIGEVTGNDVYVRSGASLNHYPVLKLHAGDRVTVVGQTGEWLEILPPEGVFSFISGDYVDVPDGTRGVVNGNNVRVRAGSALPEFAKLKYVVQTKLSKGAEVEVIGREPDGFLRIKPPKGVTVWIHRQFVQMLPGSAASLPTTGRSDIPSPGAGASKGGKGVPADTEKASLGTAAGAVSVEGRPSSALAAIADPTLRETLRGLDARAEAELKKPVEQRNFRPLIGEYEKVASGASDETGRRYARARLDQLRYMAKVVETLQELRRMNEKAESQRRRFLEERAELGSKLPPIPSDIDVQGELRTSALYPPGSQPRRFRLVDASGGRERTIGYVEIPPDAKIAVNDLVGRYVGVRASKKRLQAGAINPVPIYVAEDIVPLQPPKTAAAVSPGEH